jgi:hypothetical protein
MTDIIINKYHLYLESTQRTTGTHEDANYSLKRFLYKTNPFNHFEISVVQANIPYSFFNITNQNGDYNSMKWYLARGGASYPSTTYVYGSPNSPKTVNISNGNYTILSLITAIQLGIISDLQLNYPSYSNPNWSWTYNRDTLTVNFLLTGIDNTITTLYFMPSTVIHGGLAYNLGITSLLSFGYDSNNNSQPIVYSNNVKVVGGIAQSAINVSPITSILIRSGTLKQNKSFEFIAIQSDESDILVRVPIQTVGTTYIQYVNDGMISNRIRNEFIDTINLYITDNRSYTPISLAGLSWMCVLEVREIEGHENKDNMAYQMMKQVNFATGNIKVEQES